MSHFLEEHDYDDVAARSWQHDEVVISLDRTGLITWSWFERVSYSIEGGEQTFVEFLQSGPLESVRIPRELQDEMRAHLLTRRAGSSTFISVQCSPEWSGLKVDGVLVEPLAISARTNVGWGGWRFVPNHRALLVQPGTHLVEMSKGTGTAQREVVIKRAEHVAIAL